MPVTVKICGITSAADAEAAVEAGADFLGFVFFPFSPRCLLLESCAWIRRIGGAGKVGVFRDQSLSFIKRIRDEAMLDLVQLHGEEPIELAAQLGGAPSVIKAIPVGDRIDWSQVANVQVGARVLFDAASPLGGGSGRSFNWRLLAGAPSDVEFWLAGGLRPDNVATAIHVARPAGVDVASGVESGLGRKDVAKMRAFVEAARLACLTQGSA